jgi:hypothetical protein
MSVSGKKKGPKPPFLKQDEKNFYKKLGFVEIKNYISHKFCKNSC